MNNWYSDHNKIWELAEFLIGVGEINTAEELLYFLYHPDKYTEVWVVYQKEIMGINT